MAGPKLTLAGAETGGTQMIDGIRVPNNFALREVAGLLPYARNSRDHSKAQIAELAEQIKRVGWTNPVLLAGDEILAGHGRIMAADLIGMKRVPSIDLSHLSPEERRAYVIWDNRSAEKSSWNLPMLKLETDDLRAMGLDIELSTGFAEEDLAKLFEGMEEPPEEGDADPDAAPPEPAVAHSVRGDVWVCGPHRVMCGDCTDTGDWQVLMAGERADVVWTDPPYNVDIGRKNRVMDENDGQNRKRTGGIANDKKSDALFTEFLAGMFGNLLDVLKPGGAIYVAHSDMEGLNFRRTFHEAGFKFQSCIIWHKNHMVLGHSDFQPKHEPVLYGWKPGSAHKWFGGRKQTSVMELGDAGPFTQMPDGRWQIKVGDSVLVVDGAAKVEEHMSTMMYEAKPARSDLHPTQKPVALVERMLRNSTRPGDIAVDACSGSGTTLIASDRLGLCARVMELDPKFADVTVRRWEQYTGRRAAHAVTGESFPREDEERNHDASPAAATEDDSPF